MDPFVVFHGSFTPPPPSRQRRVSVMSTGYAYLNVVGTSLNLEGVLSGTHFLSFWATLGILLVLHKCLSGVVVSKSDYKSAGPSLIPDEDNQLAHPAVHPPKLVGQ